MNVRLEKIFAKHIFTKDYYSNDQKENFILNNVKTNSLSIWLTK